jgi:hypothetical protein
MVNWKGFGWTLSWLNLRYYTGIYPGGFMKTTKTLRIAGFRAEI